MEKVPANLKRTLPDTHLQTFVDKHPEKQFFCELSENFVTAFGIKASFRVSAEFNMSRTHISCIN